MLIHSDNKNNNRLFNQKCVILRDEKKFCIFILFRISHKTDIQFDKVQFLQVMFTKHFLFILIAAEWDRNE